MRLGAVALEISVPPSKSAATVVATGTIATSPSSFWITIVALCLATGREDFSTTGGTITSARQVL
jgi:hypothetical protein